MARQVRKKRGSGPPRAAPWLRLHLPVQETWVRPLVWEEPTGRRAPSPCVTTAEPVLSSTGTATTEPVSARAALHETRGATPARSPGSQPRVAPACCN